MGRKTSAGILAQDLPYAHPVFAMPLLQIETIFFTYRYKAVNVYS